MTIRGLVSKLAAIIAAFFKRWWKVIVGQGIYQILSWLYDNPLWMAVEAAYGLKGVIWMMISAMVINFCNLFYHRYKKISWLGLNEIEKLIPILNKFEGKIFKEVVAFLLLSIFQDSFVTTAYMRHGRNDGLKARDLAVFFASSIVSICYWAVRNGIIVETARFLLKF